MALKDEKYYEKLRNDVQSTFSRINAASKSRESQLLRQIDVVLQHLKLTNGHMKCFDKIDVIFESEIDILKAIGNLGTINFDNMSLDENMLYKLEDYENPNCDHVCFHKCVSNNIIVPDIIKVDFPSIKSCDNDKNDGTELISHLDINSFTCLMNETQKDDCDENTDSESFVFNSINESTISDSEVKLNENKSLSESTNNSITFKTLTDESFKSDNTDKSVSFGNSNYNVAFQTLNESTFSKTINLSSESGTFKSTNQNDSSASTLNFDSSESETLQLMENLLDSVVNDSSCANLEDTSFKTCDESRSEIIDETTCDSSKDDFTYESLKSSKNSPNKHRNTLNSSFNNLKNPPNSMASFSKINDPLEISENTSDNTLEISDNAFEILENTLELSFNKLENSENSANEVSTFEVSEHAFETFENDTSFEEDKSDPLECSEPKIILDDIEDLNQSKLNSKERNIVIKEQKTENLISSKSSNKPYLETSFNSLDVSESRVSKDNLPTFTTKRSPIKLELYKENIESDIKLIESTLRNECDFSTDEPNSVSPKSDKLIEKIQKISLEHPIQVQQWMKQIINEPETEPVQTTELLEHVNITSMI